MFAKKKKTTPSKNKRRQGKLAILIPWFQKFGFVIVVVVFAFWISGWLMLDGYAQRAGDWAQSTKNEWLARAGFKLENIFIEGRENAQAETIKAFINMQRGDPLFAFDPKEAQDQLKKMAWVADAKIERRWPGTIYINIQERVPTALLQKNDRLFLTDENLEIIHTDQWMKYKDLVMLSGAGAQESGVAFLRGLNDFPMIFEHMESARFVSQRRWDVTLKNNVMIKLPEHDMRAALETLEEHHKTHQLLDKDLKHIDLRDPNRMIVRTKPGQVKEYKASLKSKSENDI